MKCTNKLPKYVCVAKYSVWVNMDVCKVWSPYFWNGEEMGKKMSHQIGHIIEFVNPLFSEELWNVKHAKTFWSEKKSGLCIRMTSDSNCTI